MPCAHRHYWAPPSLRSLETLLAGAGSAAPSVSPQVPLEIHHYDLGDTCQALVSTSLYHRSLLRNHSPLSRSYRLSAVEIPTKRQFRAARAPKISPREKNVACRSGSSSFVSTSEAGSWCADDGANHAQGDRGGLADRVRAAPWWPRAHSSRYRARRGPCPGSTGHRPRALARDRCT